jgi:membrane-bound lytic murein transglycosylase D
MRTSSLFRFFIGFFLLSIASLCNMVECYAGEPSEPIFEQTPTYSVDIPKSIDFAGTTISLVRNDLRERMDRELLSFMYVHSATLLSIKRANVYFPIIESILKKNGVPEDFKYLALVESNFSTRALSGVKAAGFWQLMPETAKQYGLEVNEQVDERYNIEKSTEAACRYLKDSYAKFGDWVTVAASYNSGMTRISNDQGKQNAQSFFDLLLPEETTRYVFRILAIKEILKHPQKFGFILRKEHLYPSVRCTQVAIADSIGDWTKFAKQYHLTYAQLKDYNVWLRDTKLDNPTKRSYLVSIPDSTDLMFDELKIKIYQKNWVVNP